MKIFVDANVLVSVVNKEYPQYTYTARVLSMAGRKNTELVTSALCLAIAFYFAEKKYGAALAKSKMALLASHITIAECGEREVQLAAANKKVLDFEDGLQYYAALHSACTCIVTDDTEDFHFSELPVLQPEHFLRKHGIPGN